MKTFKNSTWLVILIMTCHGMYAQNHSVQLEVNSSIGYRNVLIGYSAGDSITDQHDNTYVGEQAGFISTGSGNTHIGSKAGINSTVGVYNTFIGYASGCENVASNNAFLGTMSGMSNTRGGLNVFLGKSAGKHNTVHSGNTYVGAFAGEFATNEANTLIGQAAGRYIEGKHNTFIGHWAARDATAAERNVLLGTWSGFLMDSGNENTMLGTHSGQYKISGDGNVYVGFMSGHSNQGSRNVFIGYKSGVQVAGDDQLYIENTDTITAPLIYGDFANDKVGINTNDVPDGYTLAVKGDIIAEEIRLKLYADGWPDYVFKPDYELKTLEETEQHIQTLGHLPGVPSAQEVGENGVQMGEMSTILLEKIEEMTLHLIDINKEVSQLRQENEQLRNRIIKLEK